MNLELRTLGTLELRDVDDDRRPGSLLAQPKRVALLAYLALGTPHGFHRRDTLVGTFWPDATDSRGRASLSQALYVLRRAIGDEAILTRGDEEVALNRARVWCDATAMEAALGARRLVEGLELYRGELLRGFFLSECPEFERWLELERARLRSRAVAAAWALTDEQLASRNPIEAARWARWAATLEPLEESSAARLIDLLARLGDRAGAVREYELYARRIEAELDMHPSAALAARVRSLRADDGLRQPAPNSSVIEDGASAPASARSLRISDSRSSGTSIPRRPRVAGVIAGAVLFGAFGAALIFAGPVTDRGDPGRVLVAEFRDETGVAALEPLGRITADWIAQGLAQTGVVQVVPAVTAFRSTEALRAGPDEAGIGLARRVAAETGAGMIVEGDYFTSSDSVVIQARIVEAETGRMLVGLGRFSASSADPMPAVDALRQRVAGALAAMRDFRLASSALVAGPPPSLAAYQAYSDGLDHFFRSDRRGQAESLGHFRRAAEFDSTFTAPLLWSVFAHVNLDEWARADSIVRLLQARRDGMAAWDRLVLDMLASRVRGDAIGAYRAARRVAEVAPNSEWQFLLAAHALQANRPAEALDILLGLDPQQGWLAHWPSYWALRTTARHLLGQHPQELADAREAQRLHPGDAFLAGTELRALAALHRSEAAMRRADEIVAGHMNGMHAPLPYIILANELRSHSQEQAASMTSQHALDWMEAQLRRDQVEPRKAFSDRAWLNYRMERWSETYRLLRSAISADGARAHHLGLAGMAAAAFGDTVEAKRIEARLAEMDGRYDYGDNAFWRAGIAARLGERDRAVVLLREAFRDGLPIELRIHASPVFDPLRGHPPFEELMEPEG